MVLVFIYSILLLAGILCSQISNLTNIRDSLHVLTNICLAYIMFEVGLGFVVDKNRLNSYGKDFLFAFLAAALPWIFCAVYFMSVFGYPWSQAFLIGIFAAPTSAGILFAMLAAAGLATSWLFKKAQVLAVFDDFAALLLLIPFQCLFLGLNFKLFVGIFLMVAFVVLAFQRQHSFKLPVNQNWLIGYSVALVAILWLMHYLMKMDLGVLLPAFAFGAILYNPHLARKNDPDYDKAHQEFTHGMEIFIDRFIKGLFMFLVGCSLPKIQLQEMSIGIFIMHVLILTVLSNLGKSFLFFCYKREASWKTRLALSVAMFPRGEVGAGILLISMGYGIGGVAVPLSILSLALNLVLTGVFIVIVIWLAERESHTERI